MGGQLTSSERSPSWRATTPLSFPDRSWPSTAAPSTTRGADMHVLVIGGNGKVGRSLVRRLLESGAKVRVLTRSPERAALVDSRAQTVVADFAENPSSSAAAFAGVDAVFML